MPACAHAKQPLPEPWRLALLEAEIALARADAEGRHADGVREAAAHLSKHQAG